MLSMLSGAQQLSQRLLAALAPPAKRVALHPAVVTHYLASVDDLTTTLSRRTVEGSEEVASALRELVVTVVVHPAGTEEPKIEVKGRCARSFPAADPSANSGSGGPLPPLEIPI
jgi:hypothetical protein